MSGRILRRHSQDEVWQMIYKLHDLGRIPLVIVILFNTDFKCLSKLNPLSTKLIKWSNTLKQIVGKLPTICLSVFDHFSGLALKGLTSNLISNLNAYE